MKKIYIDFDGTLFDTDKFYEDFLGICFKYKLNKEKIDLANKLLFPESYLFNMDKLIDYLIKEYNISFSFKNEVNNLFSNKYVFPDVISSLEVLKNKYELIILTYGEYNYQNKKIEKSSLKDYFKDIIITDKIKSTLDNVDYKNSIFIDNNPKEIKRFIEVGSLKVIRIRREFDKYSKKDLNLDVNEYKTFNEIIEKEYFI